MSEKLFFIQPKDHDDFYTPWYKQTLDMYGCKLCRDLRPEYLGRVFDAYFRWPLGREALTTMLLSINVARVDFLSLFGDAVQQHLQLGKVYLGDGTPQNDFVTFTAKRRLVIRGSRRSSYAGMCPACGRHKYIAFYPFYTLRAGYWKQPLYVPWREKGLVVSQELFSRIDRRKWKGISIFELPIVDEPRDGIDALPKDYVIGGST